MLPQTSSGTCPSPKHSGGGLSFPPPAKDYQCNGPCTSILPCDRVNAGLACSALVSLQLCPGRARLGSSLQNAANFPVGWISFLYPSALLWSSSLTDTCIKNGCTTACRNWEGAVCFRSPGQLAGSQMEHRAQWKSQAVAACPCGGTFGGLCLLERLMDSPNFWVWEC